MLMLKQGFPNFLVHDPKDNGATDWGPPLTLEGAYDVIHY